MSDREEDLDECEETTEDDTLASPGPNDGRAGELEQSFSCDDLDEEEKEVKLPACEFGCINRALVTSSLEFYSNLSTMPNLLYSFFRT